MGIVTVKLDEKRDASGSPEDMAALVVAMQRMERDAAASKHESRSAPNGDEESGVYLKATRKKAGEAQPVGRDPSAVEGEKWGALMEKLNEDQVKFLRVIQERDGIDLDGMIAAMGKTKSSSISGYQTPVQRNIRAVGLKDKDVFVRVTKGKGRNRESHFKAGRLLRACKLPE